MAKRLFIGILFCFSVQVNTLVAQTENIVGWYMPAMMPAKKPLAHSLNQPLVVPFKRAGNLILIEARVDGQTGYFIFDTGAPYLVLNRTYFRNYPSIATYTALGVSNLEVDITRTQVDSLRIRGLAYNRVEADVADLSHLENSRKTKILGLLGTNLFTDFVLKIDMQAQNITVYTPAQFSALVKRATLAAIPFQLKNDMIVLKGSINEKAVSLVFDTGAEVNVLDNDLDDAVYESFIIQKRSTLTGSVGETIEVYAGVLLRVTLHNRIFLNMKTIMANLSGIGRVYGFRVDGIIGYEFLTKSTVYVDFAARELLLQNKEYYD